MLTVRVDADPDAITELLIEGMEDANPHPIELGELVIMSDNIGAVWVIEEADLQETSGPVLH